MAAFLPVYLLFGHAPLLPFLSPALSLSFKPGYYLQYRKLIIKFDPTKLISPSTNGAKTEGSPWINGDLIKDYGLKKTNINPVKGVDFGMPAGHQP